MKLGATMSEKLYRIKVRNKYVVESLNDLSISFSPYKLNARCFISKEKAEEYIKRKQLSGLKYVIDEWEY